VSLDFRPMADRWCRASFSVAGTDTFCHRDKGHAGGHSEVRENADEVAVLKGDGTPQVIADAMEALADPTTHRDDRAALYGVLHQIQLRINRVLRSAKDDLLIGMERDGLRELGPLSIKATAIDVEWPANAPENHGDATVQEAMETYAKIAPDYFVHIPAHWEIATAALGKGVAEGDPVARELHAECKRRGWRKEAGRRLSLAVREVRRAA
jgi:hypothetical protein